MPTVPGFVDLVQNRVRYVDTAADLTGVRGLSGGEVVQTKGLSSVGDGSAEQYIYYASGRTGVTTDGLEYISGGGADDYYRRHTYWQALTSGANIDAAQFGVRTGSGIDNADALERLNAFLKASSIRHTVSFPAGLIQSTYTWWLSDLGAPGVVIEAYGTTFQSSSAEAQSWNKYPLTCLPWFYVDARRSNAATIVSSSNTHYGYKINTASRGASSVTLQTAGEASNFAVSDVVCIHGLDQQLSGTPRNSKFFEYATVSAIDGADITLDRPLIHTYHQSWPDVVSSSTTAGAPRICPLRRANNNVTQYVEIRGGSFTGHTSDDTDNNQPAIYSERVRYVDSNMPEVYLGPGRSAELVRCDSLANEVDKLIDRVTFRDCNLGGGVNSPIYGGTGVNTLTADGCRIVGAMTGIHGGRHTWKDCEFVAESADTALLDYSSFDWTTGLLEVTGCKLVPGAAINRPLVSHCWSSPRTLTTSATGANHGAGKFGFADNSTSWLRMVRIGHPVWTDDGAARGRILGITHDGGSEFVVTVDTQDTFSTSSAIVFPVVDAVRHSNNTCDDRRSAIVGVCERDPDQEARVLRLNDRQIFANTSSFSNRVPVGGVISKVVVDVSRATSASKTLRLYMHEEAGGTAENGEIRFALNVEGRREYSATSNTLVSGDSVTSGPVYGWCSTMFTLTGLNTVDEDDLPKFTVEVYVDQPTTATQGAVAFTDADATPSVAAQAKVYKTANTGATTITGFDGGYEGQEFLLLIDDANTTIDFTGTTLKGNGGSDWSPANGDAMRCTSDGTNWRCQVIDCTA